MRMTDRIMKNYEGYTARSQEIIFSAIRDNNYFDHNTNAIQQFYLKKQAEIKEKKEKMKSERLRYNSFTKKAS